MFAFSVIGTGFNIRISTKYMEERVKLETISTTAGEVRQRALQAKENLRADTNPVIEDGVISAKAEKNISVGSRKEVDRVEEKYEKLRKMANDFYSERGLPSEYMLEEVEIEFYQMKETELALSDIAQESQICKSKTQIFRDSLNPQSEIENEDEFLSVNMPENSFYEDLLTDINKSYRYGIRSGTLVLSRKLIESLLLDIFRREFDDKTVYFYPESREYKGLYDLIEVFENNINKFNSKAGGVDSEFIEDMHEIRVTANSTAHTLEEGISTKEIGQKSEDIEKIARKLQRIFSTYS